MTKRFEDFCVVSFDEHVDQQIVPSIIPANTSKLLHFHPGKICVSASIFFQMWFPDTD
jgi:hypothetical protein